MWQKISAGAHSSFIMGFRGSVQSSSFKKEFFIRTTSIKMKSRKKVKLNKVFPSYGLIKHVGLE